MTAAKTPASVKKSIAERMWDEESQQVLDDIEAQPNAQQPPPKKARTEDQLLLMMAEQQKQLASMIQAANMTASSVAQLVQTIGQSMGQSRASASSSSNVVVPPAPTPVQAPAMPAQVAPTAPTQLDQSDSNKKRMPYKAA